jgi:uncharacterized protein YtpQ (UPF0354 family)
LNTKFYDKALPYLKPILRGDIDEDLPSISEEDSLVDIEFNEDLIITFLTHDAETELFKYIQSRDLKLEQLSIESLLDIGISNLYSLAESNGLRMHEIDDDCFALLLDGNFEAALVLLDDLWNNTLEQYAPDGYAVAIPARDIIAFCNLSSNIGVEKLKSVLSNVWENGDYLLTDRILKRVEGKWSFF